MTTDDARRAQAARLKAERERRGWGVRRMARFLRDAVDDHQKPELPSFVTYVKRWESGNVEITDTRYRAAYARVLDIPETDLFGPEPDIEATTLPRSPINESFNASEWRELNELLRRTFLKRGLAVAAVPAIGVGDIRHITAALRDARKYADREVVAHFKRQLSNCVENDRMHGPKHSIPISLGLVAAIEEIAVEAKSDIRKLLLQVGAQVAEFLGWLYRDAAAPELAEYWRDRAVEWAQSAVDYPMQGYVLLKKSQAAWDDRNAFRILTLAEASQKFPGRLPIRVQAEAIQQEARGHAMLSGDLNLIEQKLNRAQQLLTEDMEEPRISGHYNEALFNLQVAICYCESGQLDRSIEVYDKWLNPEAFSRRDYGYFLALKSHAYLKAQAPDKAATTALNALSVARKTESARTQEEIFRLIPGLQRWRDRESVHELERSLLA
ncbi:XRE family transcriptional regulator [Actinomadura formosensis]|uniref:XRE family transcriptional regulator n=1 Tax=Actinomadura formosensis TaxID=60706 RepID=UPI00157C06FD|nr:XRE family transcriptional regulator [Actinomadura formosensis]